MFTVENLLACASAMTQSVASYAALLCLLLLGAMLFKHNTARFPGPKAYSLVGNILVPGKIHLRLAELTEKHGTIFSLRILWTSILVINSVSVARSLLETKSSTYWNRSLPKIVELAGINRGIAFQTDPDQFKTARKLMHLVLSHRQLEQYESVIDQHVNSFINNLLSTPERFIQHMHNVVAGISLEISHGYKIQGPQDPFVEMADTYIKNFSMATDQSAFIVNRMPILAMLPKFLPGMTFKKQAAAWRAQFTELAERGYTVALKRIKSGTYKPCMISKALTEHAGEFDPELIKYTATQVYTGGADTSLSVLSSFFLAMTLYPRVQEKAQLEIDQLLGVNRPPSFSDCEKLPYTRSLMREVFRCFPPIPLITRVAGRDDIHEGYHVSKGTILFVNIWAILHDKSVYGDPDDFRPERWLSENLIDRESDSMDIAFGFGRRACPGQRLAEKLVLTVIASTLSAFTITPTIDHDGKPIIPSAEYTDGTITFPRTFACEIRPRKPL